MAAKEPAQFEAVIVTWEDCYQNASDQFDSPVAMLRDYKPCVRKTIGLFMGYANRNDRRALVLAIDDDRDGEGSQCVGGPIYIPEGMVLSISRQVAPTQPKRRKRN